VVWLNPLLRYSGFAPKARGVQAMLPHVDAHLPVHNLESLAAFGRDLALLTSAPRAIRTATLQGADCRWN
jgi:hypothetical protein